MNSCYLSLFTEEANPNQVSKQRSDESPDEKPVLPGGCVAGICNKFVHEVGDDNSVILFDIFGTEGKQERCIHLAQADQHLFANEGFVKMDRELVEHFCGRK